MEIFFITYQSRHSLENIASKRIWRRPEKVFNWTSENQ